MDLWAIILNTVYYYGHGEILSFCLTKVTAQIIIKRDEKYNFKLITQMWAKLGNASLALTIPLST